MGRKPVTLAGCSLSPTGTAKGAGMRRYYPPAIRPIRTPYDVRALKRALQRDSNRARSFSHTLQEQGEVRPPSKAYKNVSARAWEKMARTDEGKRRIEELCNIERVKIELLRKLDKIDGPMRKRALRALNAKHVINGQRTPSHVVRKALDLGNDSELRHRYLDICEFFDWRFGAKIGLTNEEALREFKLHRALMQELLPPSWAGFAILWGQKNTRGRPRKLPKSLSGLLDEVERRRKTGQKNCVASVAELHGLPLESLRRDLRRLRGKLEKRRKRHH